jgi:hypothetical protein
MLHPPANAKYMGLKPKGPPGSINLFRTPESFPSQQLLWHITPTAIPAFASHRAEDGDPDSSKPIIMKIFTKILLVWVFIQAVTILAIPVPASRIERRGASGIAAVLQRLPHQTPAATDSAVYNSINPFLKKYLRAARIRWPQWVRRYHRSFLFETVLTTSVFH